MKFSVLGSGGFIASHLVEHLTRNGHDVTLIGRDGCPDLKRPLGHVIYAIGLTGDFRTRPYETVEAHVCELNRWLRSSLFESWTYLSSTRVYGTHTQTVVTEDSKLEVKPSLDSLYDLTKLTGEALCCSYPSASVRVVRLSNVYGNKMSKFTFLGSILNELLNKKTCIIKESSFSSKDYIAIKDVTTLIENVAIKGQKRLYNIASGVSTTHEELAQNLSRLMPGKITFLDDGPIRIFPKISIDRIETEFNFKPHDFFSELKDLVQTL